MGGTVSTTYRIFNACFSLGHLLRRFPRPFAMLNGVRKEERLALLQKIAPDHETAKVLLQKKYFGRTDPKVPVFSFVGRVVQQKGVHLILNAVRELIEMTKGRIQIIVGGMANQKDRKFIKISFFFKNNKKSLWWTMCLANARIKKTISTSILGW